MNLTRCEQRQLRHIEAAVRRSDPRLAAIMGMFGRLYSGEEMPASEHEPRSQNHLRRSAAWIVAALATAAPAEWRARDQAPEASPERADGGPKPNGQA